MQSYHQIPMDNDWKLPFPSGEAKEIAILTLMPWEITAKTGIRFDDNDDEIDHYLFAALQLDSGEIFSLIYARRLSKYFGDHVSVCTDSRSNSRIALESFLQATGLTVADIKERTSGDSSPIGAF